VRPFFQPDASVQAAPGDQQGRQYDVAADGRFLINMELDDDVGTPITLIQNWDPPATAQATHVALDGPPPDGHEMCIAV
jgi:hypothetical protein